MLVLLLDGREDCLLAVDARLDPLRDGRVFVPGEGAERLYRLGAAERACCTRDLDAEVPRALQTCSALGLHADRQSAPFGWLVGGEEAAALIDGAVQAGGEVELRWAKRAWKVSHASADALRVQVRQARDYFTIGGEVEVDGARAELAQLLRAVRDKKRYVKLSGDRWLRIADGLRDALAPIAEIAESHRHDERISSLVAPVVEELRPLVGALEAPPAFTILTERIAAALALDPPLPEGLDATLRPYQKEGFDWLARHAEWSPGALLCDDMSLGKTVQALALVLRRASIGPALVVAPTSVGFNWMREAARFAPTLRVLSHRVSDRAGLVAALGPSDVLVTSWDLLVRESESLAGKRFATIVFDEAQAAKNAATLRAQAARSLDAAFRVALTGTPIENRVGELWSILRFTVPGLLGSAESFRDRFIIPIERDHDIERRKALTRLVKPFLLRRTKREVATDLPPRTEVRVDVDLSDDERALYDAARLYALSRLSGQSLGGAGAENSRFEVLAALTRLRQLACHPRLVDEHSAIPSSKLERLLEVLDELREEGHRVLVFSQFTRHLALVRAALDAMGLTYRYLDGSTPEPLRRAEVDAFQRGEGDLFLLSLKAGGTGLNLTAAEDVVILDPWWNPAVEDQAADRAHRIGQSRHVTIYRLVARDTIEDAIVALQETKRELVAGLLDGTGSAGALSVEELVGLLKGG